MFKIYKYCFFLIIFSCAEQENQFLTNIPTDIPIQNYKLNLSSNSGTVLNAVSINWTLSSSDVLLFNITKGETITIEGANQNSYTYNALLSGEYNDIEVSTTIEDSTYKDTIQIFTRSIFPVTNFMYDLEEVERKNGIYDDGEDFSDLGDGIWNEGETFTDSNGDGLWSDGEDFTDLGDGIWNEGEQFTDTFENRSHRKLVWTKTKEPEDSFREYNIYRHDDPDYLLNLETCNCKITSIEKINDTTFIDSSLDVIYDTGLYEYYYLVQVSDGEFIGNSYIYNFTGFLQPNSIEIEPNDVSNNKENYISINWNVLSNSTYFYQYEIYRSVDSKQSEVSLISSIKDSSVNHFQDRTAGNGTTWFYSIAVVDVNGRRVFSNYIEGRSLP
tara:strand:- start:991 stop:2148 length:1158 start_codon:yes stop_codon:yes gene_type:complete